MCRISKMKIMKNILFIVLAVIISFSTLTGCQSMIFENRSECPTWIFVKPDRNIDEETWPYFSLRLVDESGLFVDDIIVKTEDFCKDGSKFSWKKHSKLEIAGVTSWEGKTVDAGASLIIPEGKEVSETMGGYILIEDLGEDNVHELVMPIQSLFANIYYDIEVKGEEYPFKAIARGAVNGYSLPSFMPHEGTYQAEARQINYNLRTVRIPRQDVAATKGVYAGALKTDFMAIFDDGSEEWETFYTLALGEVVTLQGYDWSKPILEDIHVKVTLEERVIVRLSVKTADWEVVLIEGGKYVI